ncbi:MAG: hypothetical protein ACMXYL_04390 [Candidatus Woesearchaeota archaeon]
MSMRKTVSILLGLVFLALGILPLVLGIDIMQTIGVALWILAIIGGLALLADGYIEHREMRPALSTPTTIVGLVLVVLGLIQTLFIFNVIAFQIPGFVYLALDFVFIAGGLFLIIGGLQGW